MLKLIKTLTTLLIISGLFVAGGIKKGDTNVIKLKTGKLNPLSLNYQGYLTDASGNPLNGTLTMEFSIYDSSTNGNLLWTSGAQVVSVTDGIFHTILSGIPLSIFRTGDKRWLELKVEGEILSPRTEITSSPWAYTSILSDTSGSAKTLQGYPVSDVQPKVGEVLKWNGTMWVPDSVSGGTGGDNDWIISDTNMYAGVTGNVGIGTPSPYYKLDVKGSLKALNYYTEDKNGNNIRFMRMVPATVTDLHFFPDMGTTNHANIYWGYNSGVISYSFWSSYSGARVLIFKIDAAKDSSEFSTNLTVDKNLKVNASYKTLDGQGNTTTFLSKYYNSSGNQTDFNIFPDYNPSSGYGNVVFGYNSKIANYSFYSKYSGSNYALFYLNMADSVVAVAYDETVYRNLSVAGNLYVSGSKSFMIDHPLDPENKVLIYNCVESPENLTLHRGKVRLDANGEAIVKMPDYFKALVKEDEATVNLTPIGRPFSVGYEWNADYSAFKIYGKPDREVSYLVLADRDDPSIRIHRRPVEEWKKPENRGKYLCPEAFGYSKEKLIKHLP